MKNYDHGFKKIIKDQKMFISSLLIYVCDWFNEKFNLLKNVPSEIYNNSSKTFKRIVKKTVHVLNKISY